MNDETVGLPQRVTVVDFDMEFWTLVKFLVKLALASIPALMILLLFAVFAGVAFGVLTAMFGG